MYSPTIRGKYIKNDFIQKNILAYQVCQNKYEILLRQNVFNQN